MVPLWLTCLLFRVYQCQHSVAGVFDEHVLCAGKHSLTFMWLTGGSVCPSIIVPRGGWARLPRPGQLQPCTAPSCCFGRDTGRSLCNTFILSLHVRVWVPECHDRRVGSRAAFGSCFSLSTILLFPLFSVPEMGGLCVAVPELAL